MIEFWKPISGYEGLYEVSNLGRVKSYVKYPFGKILKNNIQNKTEKYKCYSVTLVKNGNKKMYFVHTLVAMEFCDKPEHCNQVNHKDLNPLNNNAYNLEWCTPKQNIAHALEKGNFNRKPLDKEILTDLILSKRMTNKEIANFFNVTQSHVLREIKRYNIQNPYVGNSRYKITETELKNMLQNGMSVLEISKFIGCNIVNAYRLIDKIKAFKNIEVQE